MRLKVMQMFIWLFQHGADSYNSPLVSNVLNEGNPRDLVERDETVSLLLLYNVIKLFNSKIEVEARNKSSNKKAFVFGLRICSKIGSQGIPFIFLSFNICYWTIGIVHVFYTRENYSSISDLN